MHLTYRITILLHACAIMSDLPSNKGTFVSLYCDIIKINCNSINVWTWALWICLLFLSFNITNIENGIKRFLCTAVNTHSLPLNSIICKIFRFEGAKPQKWIGLENASKFDHFKTIISWIFPFVYVHVERLSQILM